MAFHIPFPLPTHFGRSPTVSRAHSVPLGLPIDICFKGLGELIVCFHAFERKGSIQYGASGCLPMLNALILRKPTNAYKPSKEWRVAPENNSLHGLSSRNYNDEDWTAMLGFAMPLQLLSTALEFGSLPPECL